MMSMTPQITVRLAREDHKTLKELSARMKKPMGQIMHRALVQLRREMFWDNANDAYAARKTDKKAWKADSRERRKGERASLSDLQD
jgi:hypothetical protein